MGIANKLRRLVGMEVTKPKKIKSAEHAVKTIKEYGGKLPTKAGAPKKKKVVKKNKNKK